MYDFDTFFVGASGGAAILTPPKKTRPGQEYVFSGPIRLLNNIPFALPTTMDDLVAKYGRRVYTSMLSDPAVFSSFQSVKLGILAGGLQLLPTRRPPVYRRKAGEHQLNPNRIRENTPEEDRAKEVCEFCRRALDRLEDFHSTMIQWLDAMVYGVKLVELTYVPHEGGEDDGKLVFESIKVKPDWSFRFVIDSFFNVQGILTWLPMGAGFQVLKPDKFAWMTFLPNNGDPRGTSILRSVFDAWNLKTQAKPMYYQHLYRWGSPGLDLEMAEGDTEPRIPIDSNGHPVPGAAPIPPEVYHSQQLTAYANGSALVHPYGSKLTVAEPNSQGEPFLRAFEWFDQQIMLGIQMHLAGMSRGGFKGDRDESSKDEKGLVVRLGRHMLAQAIRCCLKKLVAINYSPEDAELYTPIVTLGRVEPREMAELWNAVGNLARAGYLGDSQKPELDATIGLPERDTEADAEADAAKQEQMMKLQAQQPPGAARPASGGVPLKGDAQPSPDPNKEKGTR